MSKHLDINEDPPGVLTLTLNRPQQHNALDRMLVTDLHTALHEAQMRNEIRVVVIAAEGDSYCSGADLKCFTCEAVAAAKDSDYLHALADLLRLLYRLDKITVAKVQGPAFGGGVGLVVCCDLAIGSTEAVLRFPELALGLIPAVIAPYVVAGIGERRTRYLFLSGKAVSANEALSYGLLQSVCRPEELNGVLQEEIHKLLKSAPHAAATTKALLRSLSPALPDEHDTWSWLTTHLRNCDEAEVRIGRLLQRVQTGLQA